MTELIDGARPSLAALIDSLAHASEVAVEEIHVPVIDEQPAASVDALAPFTDAGDQTRSVAIVEIARSFIERAD